MKSVVAQFTMDPSPSTGTPSAVLTEDKQEVVLPGGTNIDPLISNRSMMTFELIFNCIIMPIACLSGTVCNVINITVFYKQGLTDSTNACLYALSCSDLMNCFITLIASSLTLTYFVAPDAPVDVPSIQSIFFWTRTMFSDLSMYITLLVALIRCLCIVMPLAFKTTVTFRRTFVLLITITAFAVVSYSPVFATHGLSWQLTANNRTVLQLWFAPTRAEVESFSHIFNSIVVATICQVSVFICATFMYRGLKRSSQFRAGQKPVGGLGDKEKAVVKMVFLVALVLLIWGIPQLAVVYSLQFVPELNFLSPYVNLMMVLCYATFFFSVLNCSANGIIYYHFNTRFRETLHALLFNRDTKA